MEPLMSPAKVYIHIKKGSRRRKIHMELRDEIGNEAGKVWNTISRMENASFNRLRSETELNNDEIYRAIGWLAREDKIGREGRNYQPEHTNLTPEIGGNAGRIYDLLKDNDRLTVNDLIQRGEMKRKDVWSAVGWLAREDKIYMDDTGRFTLR
jgi:hypothetical protein